VGKNILSFSIIFILLMAVTIGCTRSASTPTPTSSRENNIDGTIAVLGDVNGDGSVNMGDVVKLERIIRGLDQRTAGADVNNDGQINQEDAIKVEEIIQALK